MCNKTLAALGILGLVLLLSSAMLPSQSKAEPDVNSTVTPNYSVYLPTVMKNWPPIRIEFIRPTYGELVGDGLQVAVTVDSLYELQGVIARVEDRETDLEFSPGYYWHGYHAWVWVGTLSLAGLESGDKLLAIVATDVLGNSVQAQRPFVYDQEPELTVIAPLNEAIARPEIYLRATCTDNDPTGCVSLTVTIDYTVVVSRQSDIDETVSLADYDGREVTLQFEAQDSVGQYAREERTVYVESSTKLAEVETVSGSIWDVQPSRILFLEKTDDGSALKILARTSGQETTVMDEIGKEPQYGYLTPLGAIFVEQSGDYLTPVLYEWQDGELIELSPPSIFLSSSLRVAGNYAMWRDSSVTQRSTLIIRDLISGTNTVLSAEDIGTADIEEGNVAANGDAVWYGSLNGKYQIFRYRQEVITQLTDDADLWNIYPRTDGINVVYKKRTPRYYGSDTEYQIAVYGAAGEVILTAPRLQEPSPGEGYQVNNGWVAFTELGPSQVLQVWVRSPSGQESQGSYFNTSSQIDALGPNGEVAFINTNPITANRRYLSVPDYGPSPTDISSSLGWSFWQEGHLFVVIGHSLFQVQS